MPHIKEKVFLLSSTPQRKKSNLALKMPPCLNEMTFNAELIKWPEARL